jgi:putative photosynthetic complex assembly protein 2
MMAYAVPVLFTLLVWWFTTGVVLFAVNRHRRTYRVSVAVATLFLAAALAGLRHLGHNETALGAYAAFGCAILVWGWIEFTYYAGLITGPRPHACPVGVRRWQRFALALQASLYHELLIVAFAFVIALLTWGEPNQVGTWTFVVLWLMRWSTKLNIFLGVPHFNLHWFPDHLRYLETFMIKRPMNALFPFSIAASLAAAALLLADIARADASSAETVSAMLLTSLIVLAIAEHGFLVLPLREAALWAWALPATPSARCTHTPPASAPGDDAPAGRIRHSTRPFAGLDTVAVYGSSPPPSVSVTNGR